jgi:hypothetical protein
LGEAGAAFLLRASARLGQAKSKYAGTTIRGAAFSLPFHEYLRNYFPEFDEAVEGGLSSPRPTGPVCATRSSKA